MARTVEQAIAWARANPTRQTVAGARRRLLFGWRWDQLCAAFVHNAMGASESYASANAARAASGWLRKSRTQLPVGAITWFDIGRYGHVGIHIGEGRILMASRRVTDRWGNGDLGTIALDDYLRVTAAKYLGWSMRYGSNRWGGHPQSVMASLIDSVQSFRLWQATERDDMIWVRRGTGNWFLFDGMRWTEFTVTPKDLVTKALRRRPVMLSESEFDALKRQLPGAKTS